jgi:hypothetical protein
MTKTANAGKKGEAYAFFYCNGKKEEIQNELPNAKRETKAPSELELTLAEVSDKTLTSNDPGLARMADEAKSNHLNFVLKGALPGAGNMKTAGELTIIVNNLYLSQLYTGNEPFCGGTIYRRGDQYVFKK